MRTSELDYELPPELIAERPCEPRDAGRLLHLARDGGALRHARFAELAAFLRRGDLLVLNSARVLPARVLARLEPGAWPAELLLLDPGTGPTCRALAQAKRRLAPGARLVTEGGAVVRLGGRGASGEWTAQLEDAHEGWTGIAAREGHVPLPPYILRKRATRGDLPQDREWYQTVFADRDGAVAAPTAGLHFTARAFETLAERGIGVVRIFLRVGPGTFLPVRAECLEEHRLLPEEFEIGAESAERIRRARSEGGRVIAVGTTVVRALEHGARGRGEGAAASGSTDLFIRPPFEFRAVDGLLTNFHLPRSTLLALVYAFGGTEQVRAAYAAAVRERYRFYSYGDAMLIL
ncbi:MAG: tRNA preQ1(34) S-adenosylmethionine ribosyltransferase-isomerase QueA [Verrucomicrobiae bacterium]|nr:tRNA preQ1(34) S-adenosylmethionine ribosyltransferase-isomerase QueA [Verrucomicrobiae bacterium]